MKNRFGIRVESWRIVSWIWPAAIALSLVGCSVLTVDVDVYKGPLINEERTQLAQLAVMAQGAKPLLVSMRDEAECDYDDERVKVWRSKGWKPRWMPGHSITNDLAIRLNDILSLYEDRTDTPGLGQLQDDLNKAFLAFKSGMSVVHPSREEARQMIGVVEQTLPEGKATNELAKAFRVFLGGENSYRAEKPIFEAALRYASNGAPALALSPTKSVKAESLRKSLEAVLKELIPPANLPEPLGSGGSNARFELLEKPDFVRVLMRGAVGASPGNVDGQEKLVSEVTRIATAFRESRRSLSNLWDISLEMLDKTETRSSGNPQRAHLASLIAGTTRTKMIVALLKMSTPTNENTNPSLLRFSNVLVKYLPPAALSVEVTNVETPPFAMHRSLLRNALSQALKNEPRETVSLLRDLHQAIVAPEPNALITNIAKLAGTNYLALNNRKYGLVEGPVVDFAGMQLVDILSGPVELLIHGGSGLAGGRLRSGIETLTENYLERGNTDGEATKIVDALTGFAEKVKFLGDNEILLTHNGWTRNLGEKIGQPTRRARRAGFAMLMQSLGNSTLALVDEYNHRSKYPVQAHNPSLGEERAELTGMAFLTNTTSASVSDTNRLFSLVLTNALSLKTTNTVQAMETLTASLRNLHVLAVARQETNLIPSIRAAMDIANQYRGDSVRIRPPIAFLRSASAITSVQSGSQTGWKNMLEQQSLRGTPFFGTWMSRGAKGRVREEVDKQNWQSINQVRVAASGSANYAVVKDDVGNWYVKGFRGDPTAIIEGTASFARQLAGPDKAALAFQQSKSAPGPANTRVIGLSEQATHFLNTYGQQTTNQLFELQNEVRSFTNQLGTNLTADCWVLASDALVAAKVSVVFASSGSPSTQVSEGISRSLQASKAVRAIPNLKTTNNAAFPVATFDRFTQTISNLLTARIQTVSILENALDVLHQSTQSK